MLRNRPVCYKLNWILSPTTLLPSKRQRILSQVAESASGVPQGSVLGSILFVIYVNEFNDNLTIDHLLYIDDFKLIAPRKQSDALISFLVASSKWSEDCELILNPSNSEHLPV